jgi:ABC-2 type transport system ATP-binding protein
LKSTRRTNVCRLSKWSNYTSATATRSRSGTQAERLCDRVALIDSGRVVAIDAPSALADAVGGEHQIRFRPSAPFADELLTDLPEVRTLARHGDQLLVTGTADALGAVVSMLARNGIVAEQLRVEQASLEDAFVALTGGNSNHDPEHRHVD